MQETNNNANTTLIWWGLFEDEGTLEPLIQKFETENPGVDVQYVQKDKETYISEVNSILQDGQPNSTPDIFMLHNSWLHNYFTYISPAPESIYSFRIPVRDYSSEFFFR